MNKFSNNMIRIGFLLFCIFNLSGCDKETSSEHDNKKLEISSVQIDDEPIISRGAVWRSEFLNGHKIGVVLSKNNTIIGDNVISWTKNGSSWTASEKMELNSEPHKAYAYYPYNISIKNIEQIPITYDLSDYMWAQSTQVDISSLPGKNIASFSMKHIMTRVALKIRKDASYIYAGNISYIAIRNAPRRKVMQTDCSGMTFSAISGVISDTKAVQYDTGLEFKTPESNNQPLSYPITITTEADPKRAAEIIVAPFTFNDNDVEFVLNIDDKEYIIPVPVPKGLSITAANGGWTKGHNYRYLLTITSKHLLISSFIVNDWQEIL